MDKENEKIITDEFPDLKEIFEIFFKSSKRNIRRDKNVITTCNITKQQAKQGLIKNVKISGANICNTCKSTGKKIEFQTKKCEVCNDKGIIQEERNSKLGKRKIEKLCNTCQCEDCYGRGYIYNEKSIELKIPPKIKNNDLIIIEKQGNQFRVEKERGNLIIKIHIYGNRSKRKGKIIYE